MCLAWLYEAAVVAAAVVEAELAVVVGELHTRRKKL
jgi:hypothetical protein